MRTREKNLDHLRIIAAFLVVMLHVCVRPTVINIHQNSLDFTIANLYNGITRIAVPIFVLLSGAFLLENEKNGSYIFFYKKALKKVVLPTFISSFIYFYYAILLNIIQSLILPNKSTGALNFNPISILKWPSFYHLWYMYMIIGLYIVVPLLIHLKSKIGNQRFMYIGILFLLIDSILVYYNEKFWPTRFINYLGYFILGYAIHNHYQLHPISSFKKNQAYLVFFCICYIVNVLGTELIVRKNYFSAVNQNLILYGNLAPFIVLGSICLFCYFNNLPSTDSKFLLLAPHTLNIYIVHAGILMPFDQLINNILRLNIPVAIYIPVLSVIVFILSYIVSHYINLAVDRIKNIFSKLISNNSI